MIKNSQWWDWSNSIEWDLKSYTYSKKKKYVLRVKDLIAQMNKLAKSKLKFLVIDYLQQIKINSKGLSYL